MGINSAFASLLVRAREAGAVFGSTATIGRQSLTVPVDVLAAQAVRLKLAPPDWPAFARDGFAEDFFRQILGATEVTSFDNSPYQGATVVHDFNRPIPASFHQRFDTVVDGGSLEHIFDVKQALENYINMTRAGGLIFINTPANNLCGHGFYQFSPDFFYRVFDESNGFKVENLTLIETPLKVVEVSAQQRCYRTADPARLRQRILLINDRPVTIHVQARRLDDRAPFHEAPQQSDSQFKWNAPEVTRGESEARPLQVKPPFAYLSRWEVFRRQRVQRRKNALNNRKWFERYVP